MKEKIKLEQGAQVQEDWHPSQERKRLESTLLCEQSLSFSLSLSLSLSHTHTHTHTHTQGQREKGPCEDIARRYHAAARKRFLTRNQPFRRLEPRLLGPELRGS